MLPLALVLSAASPLAAAYTWSFPSQPTQCGNVTITVDGGTPPYYVLVVPSGISPLPGNIEARKIQDEGPFNSNSISFKLNYPANSAFVAVMTDSTGFASGGTSVGVLVGGSSDASCFNASTNVSPEFFYNIDPSGVIAQCVTTRIWWDPTKVSGTPTFKGVIPGGDSFVIAEGSLTTQANEGLGFSWTPPLRGGTTLLLVSGDNNGNGTGGSSPYIVSSGPNNDNSCLNANSPSSTPGSPAGGSYATGTSSPSPTSTGSGGGGGSGSGSGSHTNVAAVAGGTVGGVVLLIAALLVGLFFLRRRRLHAERRDKIRPDLLQDEGEEGGATARNELPQYYQPEPFMVPLPESTAGRPSMALTSDGRPISATDSDGRPLSTFMGTELETASRSGTPDPSSMSTSTRKTPMRQMRPVNIIQHADAGPSMPSAAAEGEEEPETVELPPAYTNIRK